MEPDEVSESQLHAAEGMATDHDHHAVDITDESLGEHLTAEHGMSVPDHLSFGALRGMHDRFHHEGHAIDD